MDELDRRSSDWRTRLQQAVDESGMSLRAVSLMAGMRAGYLHEILKQDKEPSVDRLVSICDALGITLTWLIYGIERSPQDEEILTLYANLSPAKRLAFLAILTADQER